MDKVDDKKYKHIEWLVSLKYLIVHDLYYYRFYTF